MSVIYMCVLSCEMKIHASLFYIFLDFIIITNNIFRSK